jgi:hypothetical protein
LFHNLENILFIITYTHYDVPPHSLKDSNASSKVKTMEVEGVGVCSLVHNTLGVEGHEGGAC